MTDGHLSGIRVVDATAYASGPLATVMLADQGADVIKIEPPGTGDLMRAIGSTRHGMSSIFATLNRNKRSLAVDLATDAGRDVVGELLATADVFVHNFKATTPGRLGLDEPAVRARNDRIVYAAISGFGSAGPLVDRGAYDSLVQAMSGIASHQADPETGVPTFVRNAMCDKTTGLVASQLITSALLARERTGEGQHVTVSMLHAALYFMWSDGMQHLVWLDDDDRSRATQPPVRQTADGFVAISTNQDAEFVALCSILGLDELARDPRFAEAGARSRNADDLWWRIDDALARRPTAELVSELEARGVPHAHVVPLDEVHASPQVVANELTEEMDQPPGGRFRAIAPLGEFGGRTGELRPAPLLGEHTASILGELGYDDDRVRELIRTRIVSVGAPRASRDGRQRGSGG